MEVPCGHRRCRPPGIRCRLRRPHGKDTLPGSHDIARVAHCHCHLSSALSSSPEDTPYPGDHQSACRPIWTLHADGTTSCVVAGIWPPSSMLRLESTLPQRGSPWHPPCGWASLVPRSPAGGRWGPGHFESLRLGRGGVGAELVPLAVWGGRPPQLTACPCLVASSSSWSASSSACCPPSSSMSPWPQAHSSGWYVWMAVTGGWAWGRASCSWLLRPA